MTWKLRDVTAAIAALDIDGVTIYDLDGYKETVEVTRGKSVLQPLPERFISNLNVTRQSFGASSDYTATKKDITYTLTYRFFYKPIGSGRLGEHYEGMINKLVEIIDEIVQNDFVDGAIDMYPTGINNLLVTDMAGNVFHGCDITIPIVDYYEVA